MAELVTSPVSVQKSLEGASGPESIPLDVGDT